MPLYLIRLCALRIFEQIQKVFFIFNYRTSVSGVLISLKLNGVQIQQEVSVEQLQVQYSFSLLLREVNILEEAQLL